MLIWGFSVMADASNTPFRWSGSLQTTNIRALYERCQRVRLTGLMKLIQGSQALELIWIGGEPIEGESDQGTRARCRCGTTANSSSSSACPTFAAS